MNIERSNDGGTSWGTIAAGVPNSADTTGVFAWTVTGPVTAAARIRVMWVDAGCVQDDSDVNFRITSRITVTAPNTALVWGAGSTRTINWNHDYGGAQAFDLAFSPDGGATWAVLASGVPAASATTGTYTGAMPTGATAQALIRVSPAGVPGDGDVSNTVFTLAPASIAVTAPNTGVAWTIGSSRTIRWDHNLGQSAQVAVELSRNGGTTWETIATLANTANTTGVATWTVTGPATTAARIRVSWTTNAVVQDVSDVNFTIR